MARHVKEIDFSKELFLIVDDDDVLRTTLHQLLARLKFQVDAAPSGPVALEMLSKKGYTFMLTDMKMPEMSGFELIAKVAESYPELSIIAMTGYSEGYKYVDVIHAGASDFIKKPFDVEELEAKVARIINERSLKEELCRLSVTDSLTGLFNQRHFYARLREEVLRAERQKHPLALILLDLDCFKDYNDTYGHLAGDEVLRSVGRLINKSIRVGVDSGYRYGGDEFAVILIEADLSIAQGIGRRIQDGLEENAGISASAGYAMFSLGMSVENLVDQADKGLYKAKPGRFQAGKA